MSFHSPRLSRPLSSLHCSRTAPAMSIMPSDLSSQELHLKKKPYFNPNSIHAQTFIFLSFLLGI